MWCFFEEDLSVGLTSDVEAGELQVSWVIQRQGTGPVGLEIGDAGDRARRRFGGQQLSDGLRRSDESGNTLDVILEDDKVGAFILTRAGREAPKEGLGGFPRFEFRGVRPLLTGPEVEAVLGRPAETYAMENWQSWVYPGLTLNLAPVDGSDRVIWMMVKEGELLPGLSLGCSYEEVREVFCPWTSANALPGEVTELHGDQGDCLSLWFSDETLVALTVAAGTLSDRDPDRPDRTAPQPPNSLDGVRIRMTSPRVIEVLGPPDVVWELTSLDATWVYLERGLEVSLYRLTPADAWEVVGVSKTRGSWESIWIGEAQADVEDLFKTVALETDLHEGPTIILVNPATGNEFYIVFVEGWVHSFTLTPPTYW